MGRQDDKGQQGWDTEPSRAERGQQINDLIFPLPSTLASMRQGKLHEPQLVFLDQLSLPGLQISDSLSHEQHG